MRPVLAFLALAVPFAVAGSAPVHSFAVPADQALADAQAEAEAAGRRLATLETAAARASGEAGRLRAQQAAAAAAIEDSEARISATNASLRLAQAKLDLGEQRLARRRAPLAALLAGLATMGRQPPLLALADSRSIDELVRVRALLDATMPVIERRSAALAADVAERRRLVQSAQQARSDLVASRELLARRQHRFAQLEATAVSRAALLGARAFGAGDRVIASAETLGEAGSDAAERRAARANAAALIPLALAPARPMRGDAPLPALRFKYSLPIEAPLIGGLGSVSRSGIVSRGLRFDSRPGALIIAPADGKIVFAAPYRAQDGVVIIDHGNGWTSLLLGVASDVPRGGTVQRGQTIGRALGPVGVELRRAGRPVSAAFIAASSVGLSNAAKPR